MKVNQESKVVRREKRLFNHMFDDKSKRNNPG